MSITKIEMAEWIECIASDKRVPKDVREMCNDLVRRARSPKKKQKTKK